MALLKELTPLASFCGRIDDTVIPNFQSRHRICRTARFVLNFATCRAERTPLTSGANSRFRPEHEWQIRATQIDGGANIQRFHATCEKGLEEILAAELSSPLIRASQVEVGLGGVSFTGNQTTGYNANLWLRTGDRVLCELARGLLPADGSGVYDFVRAAVDWPFLLGDDATPQNSRSVKHCKFHKFAVQTRLLNSDEDQSSVSDTVREAIWDSLRDRSGRPWPEMQEAVTVPLFLLVDGDSAVLYRDMSGMSLYQRGYGDTTAQSKEGVAAAVLTIARWNHLVPGFGEANENAIQGEERVLLDPFCGSGFFLIHAALIASNVAPGLMRRRWPFQAWHDYDQRAWTEC